MLSKPLNMLENLYCIEGLGQRNMEGRFWRQCLVSQEKQALPPLRKAWPHGHIFIAYSPKFNDIEYLLLWLKNRLRKILPMLDSFDSAPSDCL